MEARRAILSLNSRQIFMDAFKFIVIRRLPHLSGKVLAHCCALRCWEVSDKVMNSFRSRQLVQTFSSMDTSSP